MTRRRLSPCARLAGIAIEMPPAVYVALTGRAPSWVRIWFIAWLSLWLLSLILASVARQSNTPT